MSMTPEITVPFADLTRAAKAQRALLLEALEGVVDSGWFVLGEQGRAFESEFARACGTREAVGVASGTDAIELTLRALDISRGDEVVTQANTCVPTVAAIERAGAIPALCDVDPESAAMDPASLAAAIGPATRAVIMVHLYGQCTNVSAIADVCEQHGVVLIEDCAQAHGARWRDRHAGTFGLTGCFSFYPTKNLGALGDAGAVVTDAPEVADRLRRLRQYGQQDRYHHVERGVNSRLDELQAAVLRSRLPSLAAANARRREIADYYMGALDGTAVRPLRTSPDALHAFHLFVVRVDGRDSFRRELLGEGIETLVHYPRPVHGHPPYRSLGEDARVPLANAEELAGEIVSLPLYPDLTDIEVAHVAACAQRAATPRTATRSTDNG
jgi:dTDP-4-amino-4,6-dideoxygalactose transaminase